MEEGEEFFEISAVSRLTGISSHVLRVWERRYAVVEPKRSETKRRMYSASDIQRLALVKTLVDNGHSIGSVANLSTKQLEDRLTTALGQECPDDLTSTGGADGQRVAVIGTKVRQVVRRMVESSENAQLVGEFDDVADFVKSLRTGAADVTVCEKDTLFDEDVDDIRKATRSRRVERLVFVYHFAGDEVLKRLESEGCVALRAPVDAPAIRQACELLPKTRSIHQLNGDSTDLSEGGEDIPERLFSDEQLAEVAQVQSAIDCECPQHMGHIISGLFAFEKYSEQCESRDEEDAELHAFLHRETAQCRSRMEKALAKVLAEEGIEI